MPEGQRHSIHPPGMVTWLTFPNPKHKHRRARLTAHLAGQNTEQADKCAGVQKATLYSVNQMDSQIT